MNIKYDSVAAEKLISDMDQCCQGIQREAQDLLMLVNGMGEWKDSQFDIFQSNINKMAIDLNETLRLESEYMNTFQQRISELRG